MSNRISVITVLHRQLVKNSADLLFTYKLVFGILDMDVSEFLLCSLMISDEATVTNYTYHPPNRVSDITVLVKELFVFGMFCQSVLILLLTMPLSNH